MGTISDDGNIQRHNCLCLWFTCSTPSRPGACRHQICNSTLTVANIICYTSAFTEILPAQPTHTGWSLFQVFPDPLHTTAALSSHHSFSYMTQAWHKWWPFFTQIIAFPKLSQI